MPANIQTVNEILGPHKPKGLRLAAREFRTPNGQEESQSKEAQVWFRHGFHRRVVHLHHKVRKSKEEAGNKSRKPEFVNALQNAGKRPSGRQPGFKRNRVFIPGPAPSGR